MDALDHDISDEHALLVVHTDCEGLLIQDEREKFCIFQNGCIFSAQATKTMMKLVTYLLIIFWIYNMHHHYFSSALQNRSRSSKCCNVVGGMLGLFSILCENSI